MKKLLSALFAAALITGVANAANVTFYTTSWGFHNYGIAGGNHTNHQTYEVHELTMKVTAAVYDSYGNIYGDANPNVYAYGTGVTSHRHDNHEVDGGYKNEVLVFDFDQTVQLVSAVFSYVDGNDEFDFFLDLGMDGTLDRIASSVDIPSDRSFEFYPYNIFGDVFGIGASGKYDNWKLKAITVSKHIPEVPVPAALPLFLAGLGAIGWAKRRRKTA